ncbi:hypothetical protein Syun_024676 [Stephania yunnanensis]|uniref:FHA domain-containing protein n=1 Tax=Stephania yunnanensis TaxID=152371 RepID=A0AAP0I4T3_9MAGN
MEIIEDSCCKQRHPTGKKGRIDAGGFFYLVRSSPTNSSCKSICLRSGRVYTIGRKRRCCDIVFNDPRVSKRHCQVFLDEFHRKVFILDGSFLPFTSDLNHPRLRFAEINNFNNNRPSANGVFVNGSRLREATPMELSTGDQVSFVCANKLQTHIGFLLERVVFVDQVLGPNNLMLPYFSQGIEQPMEESFLSSTINWIDKNYGSLFTECETLIVKAAFLLQQCRKILHSADPIFYLREEFNSIMNNNFLISQNRCLLDEVQALSNKFPVNLTNSCGRQPLHVRCLDSNQSLMVGNSAIAAPELQHVPAFVHDSNNHFRQKNNAKNHVEGDIKNGLQSNSVKNLDQGDGVGHKEHMRHLCSSSGKKFYLNQINLINHDSGDHQMVVSLQELLYPVESILRMFIATFTSDIPWFLSSCEIPYNLPVTIACHNTERCWSSSLEKRTSTPYADYPNLVVVYPPFPDDIAFGKDRKKQGIACHHPKLLVLERKDNIRVIITSANLVSKQWNDVTNTIWWQDFPLITHPDYSTLFISSNEKNTFKSDFAAQLAGFMASLLVDVPSQGHWITVLTKYDFGGAAGYLVASIPGMHMRHSPCPPKPMRYIPSVGMKFLGIVEASLVGLKHHFHTPADPNGAQLKTLAAFVGKHAENAVGMSEVLLKRNYTLPVDQNAVNVLIGDPDEFSEGDFILLGFLPRNVAKWVAPLCDAGLFSFSAFVYPKELLAAALKESNSKVHLILYVSQGPNFPKISCLMKIEHVAALCSLIASIQRCVGLSRLAEVLLGSYQWPEVLETDFIYGSSSIGTSVNPQFLAAFSAAAGKRSTNISDSEESDPEWGQWNVSQELKNPSMRIVFPTIERVKGASCGIHSYRRLLCLSEKTWLGLRWMDIFHDAVPHPDCRVGYPMHSKVARRRFQSKTEESSSFGWVYCGSHNFSPAAWGYPVTAVSKTVGNAESSLVGPRLRVCNYELGIIFIVPPPDKLVDAKQRSNLDDIVLPFAVPSPKYRSIDRPATAQAMRGAFAERRKSDKEVYQGKESAEELMDVEIPEEEEIVDVAEYIPEEKEEDKAYAEVLWSQINSSSSCH